MEFRKARWTTRLKRFALAVDSWLDDTLWGAGRRSGEFYERIRSFADRFTVTGGKRVAAEFASEGLNVGIAGSLVVLLLAIPAFREGREEALKNQVFAVTFLDRYGSEIGHRGARHDDSLKLEELPDHLIKAVLATEDRRFYDHFGIDIIGTFRALTVNARASGVVQGGSSITQQLAKNLFLSNERSLDRKIKEAFLALWLEYRLSKNEILKLYLDRAYMGGGTFGVAAAAEYYFGKSVKDVSVAEAAMLAGLFKAPTKYAPHVNLPAARARANDVLNNMVDAGFMTAGQIDSARRNPATPVDRKRDTTPDYYLDWAFDEVKRLADNGEIGPDRVLTVKTPYDPAIQQRADEAIESILRQHGPAYHVKQAATVIMDPDGAVRAIVGGRDYGASQFNRATAARQPGSSFKPYVYAAALSAGLYKPTTIVTDRPVCIGNWCPNNYGRSYAGSMPLTVALAKSINTIPVQMSIAIGKATGETHEARAAKIGRAKIVETARAMGLTTPLTDTVSLPIGAAEVTVMDQAAGYAVFANGGKRAQPYAAIEIRNSQGDDIYRHDRDEPPPKQVLSTQVVQDMNFMLSKVPTEGTGRRAALEGVITAGKTGTTNGYKDAWYVGFSGNLVGAVWFGNDDSTSTANMTGGALPAMTWKEIMQFAHQGLELKPIPGVMPPVDPKGATVAKANTPATTTAAATGPGAGHMPRQSFEVLSAVGQMFKTIEPIRSASAPMQVGIRELSPPGGGIRLR